MAVAFLALTSTPSCLQAVGRAASSPCPHGVLLPTDPAVFGDTAGFLAIGTVRTVLGTYSCRVGPLWIAGRQDRSDGGTQQSSATWCGLCPRSGPISTRRLTSRAAVSVSGTLRLTGHSGESAEGVFSADPETQIRQVVRNVGPLLAEAGADGSDLVEINSYHVGLLSQPEAVLRVAAESLFDPYPAWTAVGVTELIVSEALVEIRCVAVIPTVTV